MSGEAKQKALARPAGYAFRTQIPGEWETQTEAVHAALRGETEALPEMVQFCREAAIDAEAYGEYQLAEENRADAARLNAMISLHNSVISETKSHISPPKA